MAKNTYYIDKDTGLCKIKNKSTKQESIIKEFHDFRQAKFYSLHIYGTEFERANYIGSYEDSRIYEYEDLQKKLKKYEDRLSILIKHIKKYEQFQDIEDFRQHPYFKGLKAINEEWRQFLLEKEMQIFKIKVEATKIIQRYHFKEFYYSPSNATIHKMLTGEKMHYFLKPVAKFLKPLQIQYAQLLHQADEVAPIIEDKYKAYVQENNSRIYELEYLKAETAKNYELLLDVKRNLKELRIIIYTNECKDWRKFFSSVKLYRINELYYDPELCVYNLYAKKNKRNCVQMGWLYPFSQDFLMAIGYENEIMALACWWIIEKDSSEYTHKVDNIQLQTYSAIEYNPKFYGEEILDERPWRFYSKKSKHYKEKS